MDDYITCKTGEEIYGVFAMKPNKENNVSVTGLAFDKGQDWKYFGFIRFEEK